MHICPINHQIFSFCRAYALNVTRWYFPKCHYTTLIRHRQQKSSFDGKDGRERVNETQPDKLCWWILRWTRRCMYYFPRNSNGKTSSQLHYSQWLRLKILETWLEITVMGECTWYWPLTIDKATQSPHRSQNSVRDIQNEIRVNRRMANKKGISLPYKVNAIIRKCRNIYANRKWNGHLARSNIAVY